MFSWLFLQKSMSWIISAVFRTFLVFSFLSSSNDQPRKRRLWRIRASIPAPPPACEADALPFELIPQLRWMFYIRLKFKNKKGCKSTQLPSIWAQFFLKIEAKIGKIWKNKHMPLLFVVVVCFKDCHHHFVELRTRTSLRYLPKSLRCVMGHVPDYEYMLSLSVP